MKRMEGRQGRRFSLINLRSSSSSWPKTPSKSVSLSPTVTVLTPSLSTAPAATESVHTPSAISTHAAIPSPSPCQTVSPEVPSSGSSTPAAAQSTELPTTSEAQLVAVSSTGLAAVSVASALPSVSSFSQLQTTESCTQLQTTESSTQLQTTEPSTQLQTMESSSQIQTLESSSQLQTPMESTYQLQTPMESSSQLQTMESSSQLQTPMESSYQLQTMESSSQLQTMESSTQLQTTESCTQLCTMESSAQLQPQRSSSPMQAMESPTKLHPPESLSQLHLPENSSQLRPPTSSYQLQPPQSMSSPLQPPESSSHLRPLTSSSQLKLLESSSHLRPLASSSQLEHLPSSSQMQLMSVSSDLQPLTSSSQLHFFPASSTLQLIPATRSSSSSLQILPASSTTLQLVPTSSSRTHGLPSSSTIHIIPSASSVQRVPSTCSQHLATPPQSVYTTSQAPLKSSGPKPRDKSSSSKKKSKGKKSAKRSAKQPCQCPHTCHHSNRCSERPSGSTGCLLGETHMSKKEIVTKYRLHIFVTLIFLTALLFVSLGWYYRDKTRQEDFSNQKIFLDPRSRRLTLSDDHGEVQLLLGQDLPRWQLPLHCPLHLDGNPNSKECIWKNRAVVRVDYFVAQDSDLAWSAHCYNVSWLTISLPGVPYDCIDVGSAEWYGPSNQSAETFPVRGTFDYVPTPYHLSNGGVFSSVVDLYWLSSSGVGLLLNADNPLTLHWNSSMPKHLCVVSNYTGPLYGQQRDSRLPHLNYTICKGPDPLKTHLLMKRFLRGSKDLSMPSEDMFTAAQWSVSGITRKTDYDQQDVMDILNALKVRGMNCSLLVLDGDWQRFQGDLTFDPDRFSNLTNLTSSMQSTCSLALQISPYFDYRSVSNFHEGVARDLFVKDAGGHVPGLTRWQKDEAAAMLDVSRSTARAWYQALISKLSKQVAGSLKALRLSYGAAGWVPYRPTFSERSLSLQNMRRRMTEMVASLAPRLVLEHTADSQGVAALMAVPTDIAVRDGRSCLVHAIEKALTLGLLGYPYVLADGFGVPQGRQSFLSSQPSRDLFTRWLQMAAFFPAYKFSVPPWLYGDATVDVARNLSRLHAALVLKAMQSAELREDVEKGLPILRPVWWLDPASADVHARRVSDEFLVGDSLLVAPVLCEGETRRDIYVPRGVWSDKLRNTIVLGPKLLDNYRVELSEVPYFERMQVYDEVKR